MAGERNLVKMETTKGAFTLEVRDVEAPKHAANFLKLVNEDFYSMIPWHRVIPGFVAQAGDATLIGGDRPTFNVEAEFNNGLKHNRGALGMARIGDPRGEPERAEFLNSGSTQFYICLDDTPFLDGKYTVFGFVVDGMDVVDQLTQDDKIISAEVVESK